jgi:hypothetical protein
MVAATFLTVLGSCSPTEADEKDATAAIPFSEIGAKASADYQGDAAGGGTLKTRVELQLNQNLRSSQHHELQGPLP